MILFDLEPAWLKLLNDDGDWQRVASGIRQADGIIFGCPKCKLRGPRYEHSIICWQPHIPLNPKRIVGPGQWYFRGLGFANLTLIGTTSNSVLLTTRGGCQAHFFVEQGAIRMC